MATNKEILELHERHIEELDKRLQGEAKLLAQIATRFGVTADGTLTGDGLMEQLSGIKDSIRSLRKEIHEEGVIRDAKYKRMLYIAVVISSVGAAFISQIFGGTLGASLRGLLGLE